MAHFLRPGDFAVPAPRLSSLTAEEEAVYDELRFDRQQPRLRLEQVCIGFGWVCDRIDWSP